MNLFDIDKAENISLDCLLQNIDNFDVFCEGEKFSEEDKAKISSKIKQNSQKIYTLKRKTNSKDKKCPDIQTLIKMLQKEHKFSQNELQLIRDRPQTIFQRNIFQFRYTLDDNQQKIPKERYDQLFQMVVNESQQWKEASLQQLQFLSQNYLQIIKKNVTP